MRKQVRRPRTAQHLLNALRLLLNMCFPRRPTRHRKKFFPVPDGVTTTKIAHKEFVDVLEYGFSYQWKLKFEKEGFHLSSSMLKEFLDICVRLEEAELQKPLKKKIACAIKEQNDLDGMKPKPRHERCHGLGKCHQSKHHGGNARRIFVITM
eukprot:9581365-Ditylum_brightwellii.AAC.1